MRQTAIATFLLHVMACGSDDPAREPLCTPGRSISCIGPGGCMGGQVCAADGLSYEPCECTAPDGGMDATALDAARMDADVTDAPSTDGTVGDGDSVHECTITADAAVCACPEPPYGTSVGRRLAPFTLQQCDGTEYSIYNDDFCTSSFTVVNIAAGWSPPSIQESSRLEEEITSVYRSRGVRVIQVLVQTDEYEAPTLTYCESWVDRFGLTNVELIDPEHVTGIYFPGDSLPATIIIDDEGLIRFRENGATEGLVSLRSKLDELLAGM